MQRIPVTSLRENNAVRIARQMARRHHFSLPRAENSLLLRHAESVLEKE
jgi:hypothetical protein